MLQQFEGIVLRARDYGESNQVLIVFSETIGKIALMARGSKKTRSRFGAVTEPFTQATFCCYGGGKGMPTLTQADLIHSYHKIRFDLILTSYGAYWFELVDKLKEEREPDRDLYRFILRALQYLEEEKDPEILTRIIELKMLGRAGCNPVLAHCVSCGRASSSLTFFSVRQGGLLCIECKNQDSYGVNLLDSTARVLKLLYKVDIEHLGEIRVKPETKKQLEHILEMFISEYVHTEFRTKRILQQMQMLD